MSNPTLIGSWFSRGEMSLPLTTTVDNLEQSRLWLTKANLLDHTSLGTTQGTRPGTNKWACVGSSDGVTAGLDGVDRWTTTFTPSLLVRANLGTAHSWMVLESETNFGVGSTKIRLLLSLGVASAGNVLMSYSRSAYTGGSTTAKPTATNEVFIGSSSGAAQSIGALDGTLGVGYKMGFCISPGGEFYVYTNRTGTGVFNSLFGIADARGQQAGDTWPTAAFYHASGSTGRGAGVWTNLVNTSNGFNTRNYDSAIRQNGGGLLQYTVGSTSFAGTSGISKDVIQNAWLFMPALNISNDAAISGKRGYFQDIWVSSPAVVGSGYPLGNGTQTQLLVGDALIPSGVAASL